MRYLRFFTGIFLLAMLAGAATGETFFFEGVTGNGQYGGTLTVGDDGSMALGLAAVEDGTLSTAPAPGLAPGYDPLVSQSYTMDAGAGSGFAGTAVTGASGEQASTGTLISGTHATVSQEAGVTGSGPFNGVYVAQALDGGTLGESGAEVTSYTIGHSPGDAWGVVRAQSNNGPFHYSQSALVGNGTYPVPPGDITNPYTEWNYTLTSGVLAQQSGDFGSLVVNSGNATAWGYDAGRRYATVEAVVENGSLYFDQKVIAGELFTGGVRDNFTYTGLVTGVVAGQHSVLAGSAGRFWTSESDPTESNYSVSSNGTESFSNPDGSTGIINSSMMNARLLTPEGGNVVKFFYTGDHNAGSLAGYNLTTMLQGTEGNNSWKDTTTLTGKFNFVYKDLNFNRTASGYVYASVDTVIDT